MKIPFLITLMDDLVISAGSATSGAHQTLDYIPGSLLFGVTASPLYKDLTPDEQWRVFHSGKVRFHNAYIIKDNGDNHFEPTYPSPLNLHKYKDETGTQAKNKEISLYKQPLLRLGLEEADKNRQPKQIRDEYITNSGFIVKVEKTARMKTAIDNTSGRAAESQLFGYQAIKAKQKFLTYLEVDDSIEPPLTEQIIKALSGPARLGRSRSAEYGRVIIEKLSANAQNPICTAKAGDTTISFWCLSDLALVDTQTGQLALTPTPEHFGLTGGKLDLQKSFIRSRSYSPYNAYRKAFDSQRQLITQGSLISFSGLTPITQEQINRLSTPIGNYTETGLGWVLASPELCTSLPLASITSLSNIRFPNTEAKPVNSQQPELIRWLLSQKPSDQSSIQEWTQKLCNKIKNFYINACEYGAISSEINVGPSASQWGELYQTARDYRDDTEGLIHTLFLDEKHAICRARKGSTQSWDLELLPNQTFNMWLAKELCELEDIPTDAKALEKQISYDTLPSKFNEKLANLASEMRSKKSQKFGLIRKENEHA